MAPIDQYLMADRAAEIALARSAAPESISRDAEVLVLGRHGFETAVKGKNGFVCIVGRGWTSAADADFWNPKVRVPMCVNAAAARSYLVRLTKETEWGLAGRTPAQMNEAITAAIAKKELPPMEPGAMCYMMGEARIRRRQQPPLAFPPHVFLFGHRPRNLGSESAGFPRRCCERPRGAPDAVRDSCATLVRRNGRSLNRTVQRAHKRWYIREDNQMRNVIYAINLTLDGCCDHTKFNPDEDLLEHYTHLLRDDLTCSSMGVKPIN